MNQNYALLIGVHDYLTYDPSGNADVPGARNDARAWVRSCLSIGFSPENIRVLTSPQLSAADLGPGAEGVTLGAADRASIMDGLTWLSERIGGDAPATGLMTFSGHGEEGDDGCPLLCPSDLTPEMDNVIDVAQVRSKAPGKVKDNLTAMLDCCHAQVQGGTVDGIRAKLRAKALIAAVRDRGQARVVAACMRDQVSVSATFAGEQMGAFTWAATSTLGQWQPIVEDDVAYVDVAYGNLVTRVRVLLGALAFEQVPVVSGPKGVGGEAFLRPGRMEGEGQTEIDPTAERKPRQLDIGSYDMLDANNVRIAFIRAFGTSPPTGFTANTEYWYFYSPSKLALQTTASISLTKKDTTAATAAPAGYSSLGTTGRVATWTNTTAALYYHHAYSYLNGSLTGTYDAMSFELDATQAHITRVCFYNNDASNMSFTGTLPQTKTFTRQSPMSGSTRYYYDSTLA